MNPATTEQFAASFRRFAGREAHGRSPLYERLSLGIADDREMLDLAARARPGQPVPNLLLGAVHALLLDGVEHELAAFYPSVAGPTVQSGDPYAAFRDFCLTHREAVERLLHTRLVQTNEVRRCACLMPAFALVARRAGGRPLALVEIGASAGLNLLPDRYGYEYGEAGRYGDAASPVQLSCTLRGGERPPLPVALPAVVSRVGLDLNPIDVRDSEAMRWLRALVWPEQGERAALLLSAVAVARGDPPPLLAGDALDLLPGVLAAVPEEAALCVFHTHTVNQFPPEARERLAAILAEHGARRDLYRVSGEGRRSEPHPVLALEAFEGGRRTAERLAVYDAHGEWLEWLHR